MKVEINKLKKLEKSKKSDLITSLDKLSKLLEDSGLEQENPNFDNLKLKEKTANSNIN